LNIIDERKATLEGGILRITRRALLGRLALGAGAGALAPLLPRRARAQNEAAAALTERLHADLARHAGFGDKFSGGPGDTATAEWIAARLRASGYSVAESEFDAPFFVKRAARLTAGAVMTDVVAQAPVVTTGSAGVTAPLAQVNAAGDASAIGDVRGRIALIVAPFGRHAALFPDRGIGQSVRAAAHQGAAAVVIVTTGPSGEAIALNAPEEPFVPIPTAVLAPKHAEPFVSAARSGAEATLIIDGDATHRPCKNLVGRIERGDRWIAMSTPRTGWYGCVAERGTGTAVFLELADWVVRRFPDHSIFVMNTGGHEYFFAGSHRVLDQAPPPADTAVWAHIGATLAARAAEDRGTEVVMLDTADPDRTLMATDAAREAATAGFAGIDGITGPVAVRPGAGELSTFTDLGYSHAFAVLGLHRWFHTVEDTLERVDAELVVPVLSAHQRTIELLVGA
jgi:hypothetical protein